MKEPEAYGLELVAVGWIKDLAGLSSATSMLLTTCLPVDVYPGPT
jgi:hypothetical protein